MSLCDPETPSNIILTSSVLMKPQSALSIQTLTSLTASQYVPEIRRGKQARSDLSSLLQFFDSSGLISRTWSCGYISQFAVQVGGSCLNCGWSFHTVPSWRFIISKRRQIACIRKIRVTLMLFKRGAHHRSNRNRLIRVQEECAKSEMCYAAVKLNV